MIIEMRHALARVHEETVGTKEIKINLLAVGDKDQWLLSESTPKTTPQVTYVAFHEVTKELLLSVEPDLVVSPVVSTTFDCIDLAQILSEFEYRGAYRAMGGDLPRPRMIEQEIGQLCPKLNFAIIEDS